MLHDVKSIEKPQMRAAASTQFIIFFMIYILFCYFFSLFIREKAKLVKPFVEFLYQIAIRSDGSR